MLISRFANSNQGQQSRISQTKTTKSCTRNPAFAFSISETFMNWRTELFHVFVHIEDSFHIVLPGFFYSPQSSCIWLKNSYQDHSQLIDHSPGKYIWCQRSHTHLHLPGLLVVFICDSCLHFLDFRKYIWWLIMFLKTCFSVAFSYFCSDIYDIIMTL